ncbi:hypothetical protein ACFYOC_22705 [Nocardiopsis alba]|uniref:hypothetical protein n=1 Tax=Nocardiopsis alba TaxID=53437 RepID=UPI00369F88F2
MNGLDRVLSDLIAGNWILTLEDYPDGVRRVVAQRPVGWEGAGDPYERIMADDHAHMLRLLVERRNRAGDEDDDPDDSGPTMRGIGRDFPTLGWSLGG